VWWTVCVALTANFLLSLSVKEFLKSVNIWQSYCHPKFWGLGFFGTRCSNIRHRCRWLRAISQWKCDNRSVSQRVFWPESINVVVKWLISLSYCTQYDQLLAWKCCLSVRLFVTLCTVSKRYILQQKCLKIVTRRYKFQPHTPTLGPETHFFLNRRCWCHLANKLKDYYEEANCRNFHVVMFRMLPKAIPQYNPCNTIGDLNKFFSPSHLAVQEAQLPQRNSASAADIEGS